MTRALVIGVGIATAAVAARTRSLRWGATNDEVRAALSGDDLMPADLVATRAVTIRAPAGDVWPWIAQIGQGRGGFYSYDFLENLARCDIHSADRIVPEWQAVAVGDEVRLAPEVALTVAHVEPNQALVLQGGLPMGSGPMPYAFTWAFVLRETADGSTRFVVRERYAYSKPWAPLLVEPVEFVSLLMTQRMLRGVRKLVEQR